jgi:hypothetical protein
MVLQDVRRIVMLVKLFRNSVRLAYSVQAPREQTDLDVPDTLANHAVIDSCRSSRRVVVLVGHSQCSFHPRMLQAASQPWRHRDTMRPLESAAPHTAAAHRPRKAGAKRVPCLAWGHWARAAGPGFVNGHCRTIVFSVPQLPWASGIEAVEAEPFGGTPFRDTCACSSPGRRMGPGSHPARCFSAGHAVSLTGRGPRSKGSLTTSSISVAYGRCLASASQTGPAQRGPACDRWFAGDCRSRQLDSCARKGAPDGCRDECHLAGVAGSHTPGLAL